MLCLIKVLPEYRLYNKGATVKFSGGLEDILTDCFVQLMFKLGFFHTPL